MKLLRWILLPPVVLLAMALAVANRSTVTFSLDPFDPETPALGIEVPLFLIVLVSVLVGILAGLRALAGRRRAQPQIDELNTLAHLKALYAKPPRPDRPDDSSRPIPDALCDPVALIGQAGEALPTIRRSIDSVAGMGATSGVFIVPCLALALRMILESAQQIPPAASASILAGGPTGEP